MNINEKIKELTDKAIQENLSIAPPTGVTLASIVAANFHHWDTVLKPICKDSGIGYIEQIQKILLSVGKIASASAITNAISYHRRKIKSNTNKKLKEIFEHEVDNLFAGDDE